MTLLAEPALKLRSGKWETHWNRDTWIARMVEEPFLRCWPSTRRATGIHFQGIPTLALCMEPSLQHWWEVCLGGGCLLRFLQWSVFLLTQMSARALRVPPAPPPFTQRIRQALCSHSLGRGSSLLAVCYDLQVVCKSYSHINFCCSRKAICFVNNLTVKDAETAMTNGR